MTTNELSQEISTGKPTRMEALALNLAAICDRYSEQADKMFDTPKSDTPWNDAERAAQFRLPTFACVVPSRLDRRLL